MHTSRCMHGPSDLVWDSCLMPHSIYYTLYIVECIKYIPLIALSPTFLFLSHLVLWTPFSPSPACLAFLGLFSIVAPLAEHHPNPAFIESFHQHKWVGCNTDSQWVSPHHSVGNFDDGLVSRICDEECGKCRGWLGVPNASLRTGLHVHI